MMMSGRLPSRRLLVAAMLAVALSPTADAAPAPPATLPAGVKLAPHRAIYDLSLLSSRGTRGVESARGRIAFDFTGNACEGYGLRFRQVTVLQSAESGTKVSDLRTASYESGDGRTYRFRNDTVTEGAPTTSVDGSAERRASGPLAVRLRSPRRQSLALDGTAVFPNTQMRDLIVAAREGHRLLTLKLFDGSDDGRKTFETLAVIGQKVEGDRGGELEAAARQEALAKLPRWPVTLSYFSPERGDQTPVYVLSFDLYENGVSRSLRLDYGDFVLKGEMVRLDLLPERTRCQR